VRRVETVLPSKLESLAEYGDRQHWHRKAKQEDNPWQHVINQVHGRCEVRATFFPPKADS
jgi:hypothetical protein